MLRPSRLHPRRRLSNFLVFLPSRWKNQEPIPERTPQNYILSNWSHFDPQTIKKERLIFFYQLADGEPWPIYGNLHHNTIFQLNNFCKCLGRWSEIPYVWAFFCLRGRGDLYSKYKLTLTAVPSGGHSISTSPSPALPLGKTLQGKCPPHLHHYSHSLDIQLH